MKQYDFRRIIEALRDKYGWSQEQVAERLEYSITSVSRIEKGLQTPSYATVETALQILGVDSHDMAAFFLNTKEKDAYRAVQKLRHLVVDMDYEGLRKLIAQIENEPAFSTGLYLQFLLFCKTITDETLTYEEQLEQLIPVLKMTIRDFSEDTLHQAPLAYNEIAIIGKIASIHNKLKNHEKAVQILYGVKKSMDTFYIDEWEKSRTYPLMLYNLAGYMGALDRNNEAQEICREAKTWAIKYNNMRALPKILAYMAHNYYLEEDFTRFRENIVQAYYMARGMRQHRFANEIIEVAKAKYTEHLDILPFIPL